MEINSTTDAHRSTQNAEHFVQQRQLSLLRIHVHRYVEPYVEDWVEHEQILVKVVFLKANSYFPFPARPGGVPRQTDELKEKQLDGLERYLNNFSFTVCVFKEELCY